MLRVGQVYAGAGDEDVLVDDGLDVVVLGVADARGLVLALV